ncbi:hypothetical protein [Ulvibacterium sp.]|uniref:hypothetical protein n=1 Tax=Ulvibacterium sp. TaxID=2665914 RepID=UPI003BACCD8B
MGTKSLRLFRKVTIPPILSKGLPWILSLSFTLFIYQIHMTPNVDSMLNENNDRLSLVFLKSQIRYHQEFAPFARRPLTSSLIETTTQLFDIPLGQAFVWVNFILLFCSGVLLYILSRALHASQKHGLLNMTVYFLSFSVLFSFFPPVFSYDEPLQYCLILLALWAFVLGRWWFYVPFFTLALICRETSVLLLPALFFFCPEKKPSHTPLQQFAVLFLPLLLYGLFIGYYLESHDLWGVTQNEMNSRFGCFLENFENPKNTVESLTSLFLTLGPFLYLTVVVLKRKTVSAYQKKWLHAFLLTVALNTPLVFLTSFAREARLFALPLFFLWPVFAQLFDKELLLLVQWKTYIQLAKEYRHILILLGLTLFNYLFCFQIYQKLRLGENNYFTEYLFVLVLLLSIHFIAKRLKTF